jgi:hypothetical protein
MSLTTSNSVEAFHCSAVTVRVRVLSAWVLNFDTKLSLLDWPAPAWQRAHPTGCLHCSPQPHVTLLHPLQLNSDCYLICDSLRDPATGTCPLPDVALHLRARGWVTLVRKVIDTGTYWSKSMSNRWACMKSSTGAFLEWVGLS